MNRFGLPLVPAALALWVINLIDRLFINGFKGQAEVGIYSLAVRIASVIVFLMTAFQLAWPAFAYSIRDDTAGQAHLLVRAHLPALRHVLDVARARRRSPPGSSTSSRRRGTSTRSADAVPLLCFGVAAYSGYSVLAIGIGRMRQTQLQLDRQRRRRALVNIAPERRPDPAATG